MFFTLFGLNISENSIAFEQFVKFAESLNIPVAFTWGAPDLMNYEDKLYIGTFGTHGMRHASFAVQNADLILSLGSRLDTRITGGKPETFIREGKLIMVDIDKGELSKRRGLKPYLEVHEDCNSFINKKQLSIASIFSLVLVITTSTSIFSYNTNHFSRRTDALRAEKVGENTYKVSFPFLGGSTVFEKSIDKFKKENPKKKINHIYTVPNPLRLKKADGLIFYILTEDK